MVHRRQPGEVEARATRAVWTEPFEQVGPPLGKPLDQVERVLGPGSKRDLRRDALSPAVVRVGVLAEPDDPFRPHHRRALCNVLEELEEFGYLAASRPGCPIQRLVDVGVGRHHEAVSVARCDSMYALSRARWSPSSFFVIAATRGSIIRRSPPAASSHVHSIRVPVPSGCSR